MPRKASRKNRSQAEYWQKRMRSAEFKRGLTRLLGEEIKSLSRKRVKYVVDRRLGCKVIQEWDFEIADNRAVVDLVIHAGRLIEKRLTEGKRPLLALLDKELISAIDEILDEGIVLSEPMEHFIASMMRQEFVRSLFTELVHTSIVSFYKKVNPIFGAIAAKVLEDQIRGFIGLFMPMLVERATRFAVDKRNQAIFMDFGRSVMRRLLDEPLPHYFALVSRGQRRRAKVLITKALANQALRSQTRRAAVAVWDHLYKRVQDKRVGELLHLEEHSGWLAERATDAILSALSRPRALRFIAQESALASKLALDSHDVAAPKPSARRL